MLDSGMDLETSKIRLKSEENHEKVEVFGGRNILKNLVRNDEKSVIFRRVFGDIRNFGAKMF